MIRIMTGLGVGSSLPVLAELHDNVVYIAGGHWLLGFTYTCQVRGDSSTSVDYTPGIFWLTGYAYTCQVNCNSTTFFVYTPGVPLFLDSHIPVRLDVIVLIMSTIPHGVYSGSLDTPILGRLAVIA